MKPKELVAKWRKEATERRNGTFFPDFDKHADLLESCANELEQTLKRTISPEQQEKMQAARRYNWEQRRQDAINPNRKRRKY